MQKKAVVFLVICLLTLSFGTITASAGENTTYTYTVSTENDWVRTQDAYLPGNIYLNNSGLNMPEDIFVLDKTIYAADTGNGRIIKYNISDGRTTEIGKGTLSSPKGVFVTKNGDIYAADSAGAVYVFSAEGKLIRTIGRPDSYLYSELNDFAPKNVVVTGNGNIFVCCEGSYEGLLQFGSDGEFEGFFGANKKYLTFKETLQDLIYSDEMKKNAVMRNPRSVFNIDITERDLIFTVTQTGEYDVERQAVLTKEENCIKQFNLAGINILSRNEFMEDEWNFVDVASGEYGNFYALTATGLIYEYDQYGQVIFSFGGRAVSNSRNGLFTYAAAIDTDADGFIYVLDREKGFVQVFYPTDFAVSTHKAINELESGDYDSAAESWYSILQLNEMSKIAHIGYGKTLLHQKQYREAMAEFKTAGDKEYYSDAFWALRDQWLSENVIYFIVIIILLVIYVIISSIIKRKKPPKTVSYLKKIPNTTYKRFIHDIKYCFYMLRHPIDGYYYIKKHQACSVLSATCIYLLIFIVFMFDSFGRGYIFSSVALENAPIGLMSVAFFFVCALFIAGNYMVSTINEGEGSVRNVYVMFAYALSPYLVICPFIVAASHILTGNEAFIISFAWMAAVFWSAVLIFIGLREIHNYNGRETVKNVLLTLFFMIIAIISLAVIYILAVQLWSFVEDVWWEAMYRA